MLNVRNGTGHIRMTWLLLFRAADKYKFNQAFQASTRKARHRVIISIDTHFGLPKSLRRHGFYFPGGGQSGFRRVSGDW